MRPFAFKTQPFWHQIETVDRLRQLGHAALLSEQGTGKTKCLIDLVDDATDRRGALRILTVCPNILVENWVREIQTHSRFYAESCFPLRQKSRAKRIEASQGGPGWYVINYEGLRALRHDPKTKNVSPDSLTNQPWDYVIGDEITAANYRGSKQSQAMHDFASKKCIRIGATGTIVTNDPLCVWSIFQFINPRVFNCNFFEFQARYAVLEDQYVSGGRTVKKVKEYQNLDRLSKTIQRHSVRYLKEECLDLPERTFSVRELEMTTKQEKAYGEMRDEMLAEVSDEDVIPASSVLDKLGKLRQICQGWIYDGSDPKTRSVVAFGTPPKLEALMSIVRQAARPLLVFYVFQHDGEILARAMTKAGVGSIRIDGSVSSEDRNERVERFNTGDVPVALLQSRVCRFGLTLVAADTAVYYGNDWSLETRVQSQDRIHRIGQGRKVTYYDLVMRDSIDESILGMLRERKKMADQITGDELKRMVGR